MKTYFYMTFIQLFLILCVRTEKPNIVFILVDDLGWGDVGLHGSTQVKTPNIDVLASNGIILNNYYVSPLCSPSRGALMTGRHPIHIGLQHGVYDARKPEGLPLQFKILPQYLKDMGYETHSVGKWHLGFFQKHYIPTERGFDTHFGYWTGRSDYYNRTNCAQKWCGIDFRDNKIPVPINEYEGIYSTEIYTNKSIDIIMNRRNSSKPFFLYLAHQSVHAGNAYQPLQAPQHYMDRFKHIKNKRRQTFVAMVSALDDSIGEVFSSLKKAEILNKTIIILSTDNGGAVGNGFEGGIDGSIGSNWPLRGAKYTLFEGGVKGFGFIWSPLLKNRYVSHHLMHIHDWLPTIYSAVGGQYKDLGAIDGIDMWATLNHNLNSSRKHILHNIDNSLKVWGLRDGDYKLISGIALNGLYNGWFLPPGESTQIARTHFDENYYNNSMVYKILRQMNYSLKSIEPILVNCSQSSVKTECKPKEKPCLFNIRSDPCEHHNLFDEEPEIVKSMLKILSEYNSTEVKPIVKAVDPKANPALHNNRWDIYENNLLFDEF